MCAPMRAWSLIALSLVTSACTSHLLGFDPDEGDDSVGSVTTDKPYPYGEDWETGSFETTDTTDTTDDWDTGTFVPPDTDTGNFVPTDDTDVSDTTDTGPIPDLPPDFPSPWCGPLGIDWELDLGAGRISGLDYVPGAGMVALQLNRLGPTSAAVHRIGPGGDLQATIDLNFAFDDAEQRRRGHVVVGPGGELTVYGMIGGFPTAQRYSAANQGQWSVVVDALAGQRSADLARSATGDIALLGEDPPGEALWALVLSDDGISGPLIGVPPTEPLFDMNPAGILFDDAGDLLLAGWRRVGTNANAPWVGTVSSDGELFWQQQQSNTSGLVTDFMRDADGFLYLVVESSRIYKLDADGLPLIIQHLPGEMLAGALLSQHEPVLVGIAPGPILRRFDGEATLIEEVALPGGDMPLVAAADGCRVAVGMRDSALVVQLSAVDLGP
ncbi:MAG: hypothetical protein KC457_17425 [Myxococcales bacterium]|nr:hypothetical protein [Myxococcales bacterium]